MNLKDALGPITVAHLYRVAGYAYTGYCYHCGKPFKDLPKDFQDSVMVIICELMSLQKMVYCYEPDLVFHYLKKSGVNLRRFCISAGLPERFYHRLHLHNNREERLMMIRTQLITMATQLLRYVNQSRQAS